MSRIKHKDFKLIDLKKKLYSYKNEAEEFEL